MSHFTVFTISRKSAGYPEIGELLAPYDEQLEVEPRIYKTKQELIDEEKDNIANIPTYRSIKEYLDDPAKFKANNSASTVDYVEQKLQKYYDCMGKKMTDEDYYAMAIENIEKDMLDEDGNELTTYNPDSKWDWWQEGGRWGGTLPLKNGKTADRAYAKDVDWDKLYKLEPAKEKEARKFWRIYVEGKPKDAKEKEEFDKENQFILYKPEYFSDKYKTVERYIQSLATFATYAALDEKGWYAPGEMGWFGCSSESDKESLDWEEGFRKRFIDTLDPEDEVVIVDCHI